MIILIPLGGIGQRFKKNNYYEPKALIKVNGKEILFWLIDNLNLTNVDMVYIPYNKEYSDFDFEEVIKNRYPTVNFKFFKLSQNTNGAAETINIALEQLNQENYPDDKILCIDSDNFYTTDIVTNFDNCFNNCIFVFEDKTDQEIYSYVNINSENIVTDIKEKQKISNFANCGAYGFQTWKWLHKYCDYIISNNIKQKNEYYTSVVIKEMIKDNHCFETIFVKSKNYFSLGTPEQVKIFNRILLFDLDGTLVNTDSIYEKVWNSILKDYNLQVDKNFFVHFIKGQSDVNFLKNIISDITNDQINKISNEKDELFKNLLLQSKNVLIDGVLEFIENNKNSHMAIVTSCNKKAADVILKITGIDDYISLLITANDCNKTKPHPEPYDKAIRFFKDKFGCNHENFFIFEDSYSGYTSAKKARISNIILVIHSDSSDEILHTKEKKIVNYVNLDLEKNKIIKPNKINGKILEELKSLPIKEIYNINSNLKTGYICDIDIYQVKYLDETTDSIILKMSNFNNELSKTAIELNMYYNEAFFYKNISKIISKYLNIPEFFGCIYDDNKIGIIMDNLNKYNGSFNINLNKNINLLLKVILNISKVHKKFNFKSNDTLLEFMKDIKTIKQVNYYNKLVKDRFDVFIEKNKILLSKEELNILQDIYINYDNIQNKLSSFPLSFCHGDLKSPNIFYRNNNEPYFLDWQYIQLNKGVSDIVFLLVESIDFDENICIICERYYYLLIKEQYNNYEEYLTDFKMALCSFPFFVMVWFNSEDQDKLIDSTFPLRFMKNLLKYYNYYLKE